MYSKKRVNQNEEEEIWLDKSRSCQLATYKYQDTATIKKRKSNQLFHVTRKMQIQIIRNRKEELSEKIIVCDPHTLDEFRRNFLFNGNYE